MAGRIRHAGWLCQLRLPAIVSELLAAELGEGIRRSLRAAGVRAKYPTIDDVEAVCYTADAKVRELAPADARRVVVGRHRRPKYRWHTER